MTFAAIGVVCIYIPNQALKQRKEIETRSRNMNQNRTGVSRGSMWKNLDSEMKHGPTQSHRKADDES
jgi:hypothetical protein